MKQPSGIIVVLGYLLFIVMVLAVLIFAPGNRAGMGKVGSRCFPDHKCLRSVCVYDAKHSICLDPETMKIGEK